MYPNSEQLCLYEGDWFSCSIPENKNWEIGNMHANQLATTATRKESKARGLAKLNQNGQVSHLTAKVDDQSKLQYSLYHLVTGPQVEFLLPTSVTSFQQELLLRTVYMLQSVHSLPYMAQPSSNKDIKMQCCMFMDSNTCAGNHKATTLHSFIYYTAWL